MSFMLPNRREKVDELLNSFCRSVPGPVDRAYILESALEFKDWVEPHFTRRGIIHYSPHLSLARGRVRGVLSPGHALLLVDDYWRSGESFRGAVAFFTERGYNLRRIYGLYVFGENSKGPGPNRGISTLDSASRFLDELLPLS